MRKSFSRFGVWFSAVFFCASALADGVAPKGKTIRVKTKTCIYFDLQEFPGDKDAPSTFAIVNVIAEPTPGSHHCVFVESSLIGATVTGVTVTQKGWNLSFHVSDLTVTPRGSAVSLNSIGLVNILQAQLRSTFKLAFQNGILPPDTAVPLVSLAGITNGTATVISAGSDSTPVTPNTPEQQARADTDAAP